MCYKLSGDKWEKERERGGRIWGEYGDNDDNCDSDNNDDDNDTDEGGEGEGWVEGDEHIRKN